MAEGRGAAGLPGASGRPRLKSWERRQGPERAAGRTLTSKAWTYAGNRRKPLRVFLEDARVPIHNNACEQAIRTVAVGRRNRLFAGSPRGGRAAATIYTLIESCRKANVDPQEYLTDVLVRVASHPTDQFQELLPAKWKPVVVSSARLTP